MNDNEKKRFIQALRDDKEFAMAIHFVIEHHINESFYRR